MAASQAFSTEGVWFEGGEPTKDSYPDRILYFDGQGNVTVYNAHYLAFENEADEDGEWVCLPYAELAGLSDDEIIAKARELDEEAFYAERDVALTGTRGTGQDDIAAAQEATEYCAPKPVPIELLVETDKSGNDTVAEELAFTHESVTFSHLLNQESFSGYQDCNEAIELGLIGMIPVYDSFFGGYDGLYTVVEEGHAGFTFDKADAEGVKVK